ncbi:hypothetical protein [Arthrobacter sp. NA-172]|uniref:hypothetical protein n=1 Tax=Arthrobacter sp. NA-172 TaxID=3367524 RepID=UPI00375427B6
MSRLMTLTKMRQVSRKSGGHERQGRGLADSLGQRVQHEGGADAGQADGDLGQGAPL